MNGAALRRALDPFMIRPLVGDLDPTNRVLKRAQYEAFAFSLLDGDVRVRNESHQDPANHEYRVTIVDGVPAACECPADEMYETPCKHRVAVAIRPQILHIAAKMQAVADGGTATSSDQAHGHSDSPDKGSCDCDELSGKLPCWECVRRGRKNLSE